MSPLADRFGKTLRGIRNNLNYSLSQVSEMTGLSISNISSIETGGLNSINFESLVSLCAVLKKPIFEVFALSERVQLLGVETLSPEERRIIEAYRAAPLAKKEVIEIIAMDAASSTKN